ncbi:MAG: lamin tail domain-containing protein, partial [Polyangiales bacterium]
CDDGNACTVDACDAQGYCTNEPASNGAASDDGDECTLGDQCTNASCTSGSVIACGPEAKVVLNELESSGGAPDDWIELYNAGTRTVDLAGWSLRDNDDTHVYNLPAGSTLAPASYLVVEAAQLDFGLGGEDSARLFDVRTQPVDSYAWTAHAGVTYARCPDGSGAFANATSSTKGSANDCSTPPVAQVLINEVESNGGDPDDWIELHNAGSAPADLSGWSLRDNDDTHVYSLPAGSVIAPAGYLVIGQPTLGFGLGSEDAARLFQGSALIDSTSWTSHAAVTYGRCPNASGPFLNTSASTKGAANDCTPSGVPFTSWPGGDSVVDADLADTFADNVSGLSYEPALDVLWAVQNDPARLYRLEWAGSAWVPSAGDWAAGKALHYPGGAGAPDAEGVSRGEGSGLYVASERDNSDDGVSRMSVLRFDTASGGTSLTATHEWNLTPDLPPSGANAGLEAVAWVPDADLTARGFRDQSTGAAYDPTSYPAHGGGVFFVGLESAGTIFGYVLDHAGGGFTRVSSAPSGQPLTTDLAYDRDVGQLWAYCDDACGNRGTVLRIEEAASANQGAFTVRAGYERPANMPNYANEGIALGSEAQCAGGNKPFLWADDADTDGISIRSGTVRCGPLP